jgi:AmmeMemoRadiSam system protein B
LNDLVDQINKFYVGEEGAGLPDHPTGSRVRALVAPHIDLRMGGPVYTHAYRALAEGKRPGLFVIMGTCHSPLPQLFSLSSKEFETPFGTARLDREFYEALRGEFGSFHFLEDLSHRSEHTIEFQLLFLQHLYQKSEIMILPILASFSFRELQKAESRELFWKFVQGLKSVEQKSGTEVCYIASVDLAHMGPRYGDSFQPDDRFIEETSRKDLEMLDYVHSLDPHGFLDYIRSEEDRRRICGFPPIYTMLNLLNDVEGKVLCHSHSRMDGMGSFVTYASMVFTDHSRPGDSDNSD